jgi:hypothetical protein
LKAVRSQIEQLHGLVRGQVSVAAAGSVAGELLPSAITQFRRPIPLFASMFGSARPKIWSRPWSRIGRSDF